MTAANAKLMHDLKPQMGGMTSLSAEGGVMGRLFNRRADVWQMNGR
jgi:hypothetical protein